MAKLKLSQLDPFTLTKDRPKQFILGGWKGVWGGWEERFDTVIKKKVIYLVCKILTALVELIRVERQPHFPLFFCAYI